MEENAALETNELEARDLVSTEPSEEAVASVLEGVESQETEREGEEVRTEEDSALSTDRIGLEALEDLFTERTDDGGEEVVDIGLRTDGGVAADEDHEDCELSPGQDESSVSQRELVTTPSVSRAGSPPAELPPPQRSPSRPTVPARPPRSGISTPTTPAQAISYHNLNINTIKCNGASSPSAAPLQLVSFDVGGRLFRCKAALVRKFPDKRLFHVMSCGCEQIDRDTFFIDRNPQHFEIILDWYRTGKPLRALPPHVNEDALREDAKYFDLLDELFPVAQAAPPVPSRVKSPPPTATVTTALPKLPERPSRQPTPAKASTNPTPVALLPTEPTKLKADKRRAPSTICRFTKSETRLVPPVGGGLPVWFAMRSHEHLVVESVKGCGKLLVRVTDPTGMARVFVDQAVLFDSRSWFYLTEDGRAKLQHCVLPGNHVYTFWTEPIHEQLPSPPPQALKSKAAEKPKGKAAAVAAPPPPTRLDLEVEFKLISTFTGADEMEENAELDALLQAKGKGWSEDPLLPSQQPVGGEGVPVCLFLPPRDEPPLREPEKTVEDAVSFVERDAIAEQIRAVAAKDRSQKTGSSSIQSAVAPQDIKSPGNALKRNGAAIAQPQSQKPTANKHGEKITVYQPMEPLLATAPSPRGNAATQYNSQQSRRF